MDAQRGQGTPGGHIAQKGAALLAHFTDEDVEVAQEAEGLFDSKGTPTLTIRPHGPLESPGKFSDLATLREMVSGNSWAHKHLCPYLLEKQEALSTHGPDKGWAGHLWHPHSLTSLPGQLPTLGST